MGKHTNNNPYTLTYMLGALSNLPKMRESAYYRTSMEAIDTVADVELMLKQAGLTDKQKQVVQLYYFEQRTQDEVSKIMGVSQQAVLDHLQRVKGKLKKVLERWKELEK